MWFATYRCRSNQQPANVAPSFSAAPVIIGTPTVGVPVSYVSGAYSGVPTPTSSQQWLLDGSNISGATGSTYTPVIGDVGSNRLSVRQTATNVAGNASSTSAAVSVQASGGAVTSFTLTTPAATGTYPFMIGIPLKQGDLTTSFTTSLSNYRVVAKSTWPDGSIRHAIVTGRAALTQNVPLTVTISSGTAPTGTALTSSELATAVPTASFQAGGLGTATFSTSSPFRTWVSNTEMVECWYRASVGSTGLSIWLQLRLFADSRVWWRVTPENGFLDNGSGALWSAGADRTYAPTLTLSGSAVYTNGGAAIAHVKFTRWMAEGWIGGDPQVRPLHDAAYLRGTKIWPSYLHNGMSEAARNALIQTYTPMGQGPHTTDMGATGYQDGIGLYPNWDAAYLATGDARAFKAVLNGSFSLGSYPIVRRNATTNLPPRPSDFATWTLDGPGAGGSNGAGSGGLTWELAHHPSGGTTPYLLTGDYWHYEIAQMNAAMCYLCDNSGHGSGTSRIIYTQIRGVAWSLRTWGQLIAIAPDTDNTSGGFAFDYKALLASQYADLKSQAQNENTRMWSGGVFVYEYGLWSTTGTLPTWMMDFFVATNGLLSEMRPFASGTQGETDLLYVRDWMYRWTVGRCGEPGIAGDFSFVDCAQYGVPVATDDTGNTWYQNWGEIYKQKFGAYNTTVSNTIDAGSVAVAASSYLGNMLPALCYAVDHKFPGARLAYARLTGATNWSTAVATFTDNPVWGVEPRTAAFAPAYSVPTSANTSTLVGTNNPQSVRPGAYTAGEFDLATFEPFGGGTPVPTYGTAGAYCLANTGGHTDGSFFGFLILDHSTMTWTCTQNANGVAYRTGSVTQSETSGSPFYNISSATSGQYPTPGHTYATTVFLNEGADGSVTSIVRNAICSDVTATGSVHKAALTGTNAKRWFSVASGAPAAAVGDEGSATYDPNFDRYWVMQGTGFWNFNYVAYLRVRDSSWQQFSCSFPFSGAVYTKAVMFHQRRLLLITDDAGVVYLLDTAAGASTTAVQATTTGSFASNVGSNTWIYHPRKGQFYQKPDSSGNVLNTLTPPNDRAGGTGGTWTKGSVTIGGSGLPTRSHPKNHYTMLQYIEALDLMEWISNTTSQVALIKV